MAKTKEPKYGMALAVENAKFDIIKYTKELKERAVNGCKQIIDVPDRVTETFFNLPCVYSVYKHKGSILWYIKPENNTIQFAYPGDLLCQSQTGDWIVYARNQFKKEHKDG